MARFGSVIISGAKPCMAPPSAVTRATIGPRTFPSYVSLLATNQVRLLLRRSWRRNVSASPGKPGNGDLIGASSDVGALVRVIGREDVADQAAPGQLLLGDRPHVARLGDPAVERGKDVAARPRSGARERLALHRRQDLDARQGENRGREIDEAHQVVAHASGPQLSGPADDERNVDAALVDPTLAARQSAPVV